MTLPHGITGSLSPTFVSARLMSLAVKHPSTFALVCLIANQAEGTFGLLRYSFGGDRPSQTAQLTLFSVQFHGSELELKHTQGGISTTAPRTLACPDHRLPPILHKMCLSPISAYSKGSRGLSVSVRVRGIFTSATISPGF